MVEIFTDLKSESADDKKFERVFQLKLQALELLKTVASVKNQEYCWSVNH